MILPFGFLLGMLFQSGIQLLKNQNIERYIPWMYGINGAMSVLGSVIAVIISVAYGFTPAYFTGLSFYLIVFVIFVREKNAVLKLDFELKKEHISQKRRVSGVQVFQQDK